MAKSVIQKTCTECKRKFPATPEFFYFRSSGRLRADCKKCCYKASRLLVAAHPERKKQYSRKYYQTHREKVLSYYRTHIATNPNRLAERNKKRRAYRRTRQAEERASYKRTYAKRYANPKYRAARNARRVAERNASPRLIKQNRRRVLEWQKTNPGKKNANGHNYRAREANAEGAWSAADFAAILVRQRNACFYCSADITEHHHADHYIPLARGGSNWPSNIVAACADCNHRKRDKLPEEFSGRRKSRLPPPLIQTRCWDDSAPGP